MNGNWSDCLEQSFGLKQSSFLVPPWLIRIGGAVTPTLALERITLRTARFDDRYWSCESNPRMLANDLALEIESSQFKKRMAGDRRKRLFDAVLCLIMNFYRLQVTDPGRV